MSGPRIAETLLRGFIADPGLEEAILGDLAEELRQGDGRTALDRPGPSVWYWEQVLTSAPHLVREWWHRQSPGQAARTVARVAATLLLAISLAAVTFVGTWPAGGSPPGTPVGGGPGSPTLTLLLAGALGAAAGGFLLAWRTPRAPMCPVALLGLAWIPVTLVAAALFPSPGTPPWLLGISPSLLAALTVAAGGLATTLRGARSRRHDDLEETDLSTPEDSVKLTRTVFRLAARPLIAAALLLMVPLVAMQFTAEVNWSPFDFAFAGVLVFGTVFTFELAATRTEQAAYRWAVGVALAAAFLLIWVTGAVGIIGTEANPANLMYFGVLAVGVSGAFVARFRPRGMARAMAATAVVMALIALIAIISGWGRPYSGAVEIAVLNGFWAALFLLSARLFQAAAEERSPARAGAAG